MNFDYQQTQAEVTYQMSGIGEWVLKKVTAPSSLDVNAGLENKILQTQMELMTGSGWALVSMVVIPGMTRKSNLVGIHRSQTSNYDLFWKRLKKISPEFLP